MARRVIRNSSIKLMEAQAFTSGRINDSQSGVFVMSDPGTGKTMSVLDAFLVAYEKGEVDELWVLAPLSILESSWGDDLDTLTSDTFPYALAVAPAAKRRSAMASKAPVVLVNHDGIKDMSINRNLLDAGRKRWLCVDESTAFKNPNSQRTKALFSMLPFFEKRIPMSGTPWAGSIIDAWAQVFIIDGGERLGNSFFRYRAQVSTAEQVGQNPNAKRWVDHRDAHDKVTQSLLDISVRFALDDCVDIPDSTAHYRYVTMPPKLMAQYKQLESQSIIDADNGEIITSVHAAARAQKLCQLLTGAVYNEQGDVVKFHNQRAELVIELVRQRMAIAPCVVGFNFRHEREGMMDEAKKQGLRAMYIDGSVPSAKRAQLVRDFQDGQFDVAFLHPQAAGHGLTFTRARTLIWASPLNGNPELFIQLNARIRRTGQKEKTEYIMIAARDTREVMLYEDNLLPKIERQANSLEVLTRGTMADLPRKPTVAL